MKRLDYIKYQELFVLVIPKRLAFWGVLNGGKRILVFIRGSWISYIDYGSLQSIFIVI
jgi:hypothetical protein